MWISRGYTSLTHIYEGLCKTFLSHIIYILDVLYANVIPHKGSNAQFDTLSVIKRSFVNSGCLFIVTLYLNTVRYFQFI